MMGDVNMKKGRFNLLLIVFLIINCLMGVQAIGAEKKLVIVSSNPRNNMNNTKVDTALEIKFSKPIKVGKNFKGIELKPQKGISEKINFVIKGDTIFAKPIRNLQYSMTYEIKFPKGCLADYKGNVIKDSISVKFKTMTNKKVAQKSQEDNKTANIDNSAGNKENSNASSNSSSTVGAGDTQNTKPNNNTNQTTDNNSSSSSVTTGAINIGNPNIDIDTKNQNRKFVIHGFYSGYTKYSTDTEGYLKGLDSVSFAWLKLNTTNGAVEIKTDTPNHDFHVPEDYSKPLEFCKNNNIPAQIAIFSDGDTAKTAISSEASRNYLINKIVDSMKMKMDNGEIFEFNGVVIDFEGFKKSDTAAYFDTFLGELKKTLEPLHKKLYVAVNVRKYFPGYDYKEILKYADKVILMAHDYEPYTTLQKSDLQKYLNYDPSNPINSLAPISKVKSDLEDLISSINNNSDKDKIWLQISFGTAQWQFPMAMPGDPSSLDANVVGTRGTPGYAAIMNRLNNTDNQGINITSGYIDALQSPYITYYNTQNKNYNIILFEDDRSVKAKADLVQFEGINGLSLWRMGIVPDYNDAVGNKYDLDVWNSLINKINQK